MPPAAKRQRTSAATAAAQGTLNFRSSKAAAAAGASHHIKANKPVSTLPSKSEATLVTTDDEHSQTLSQAQSRTVDISEPSTQTLEAVEDEVDEDVQAEIHAEEALTKKALALSDTKLKAYWTAKERERKAPRVHQKELTMREKMLREWDMSSRYGVC
jgi:DNA polymerase delta subunit 4